MLVVVVLTRNSPVVAAPFALVYLLAGATGGTINVNGPADLSGASSINGTATLDGTGNLTFIESTVHVPFAIERVYYLYDVPGGSERGGHAHKATRGSA